MRESAFWLAAIWRDLPGFIRDGRACPLAEECRATLRERDWRSAVQLCKDTVERIWALASEPRGRGLGFTPLPFLNRSWCKSGPRLIKAAFNALLEQPLEARTISRIPAIIS